MRFMFNNRDLIPSDNGDVHENFVENRLRILSFFSRLYLWTQLLIKREFGLELKRRDRTRVQTELVESIALRSRSQVKLKFGHFTS